MFLKSWMQMNGQSYVASKFKILCVVLKLKNALDNNCVKHENTRSTTCVLYEN